MPSSDFDANVSSRADVWGLRIVGSCALLFGLVVLTRIGEGLLYLAFVSGPVFIVATAFALLIAGFLWRAFSRLDRWMLYFGCATIAYAIAFLAAIHVIGNPDMRLISAFALAYGACSFFLAHKMVQGVPR